MKRWEYKAYRSWGAKAIEALLAEGWEPFAVTANGIDNTIHLKRCKEVPDQVPDSIICPHCGQIISSGEQSKPPVVPTRRRTKG